MLATDHGLELVVAGAQVTRGCRCEPQRPDGLRGRARAPFDRRRELRTPARRVGVWPARAAGLSLEARGGGLELVCERVELDHGSGGATRAAVAIDKLVTCPPTIRWTSPHLGIARTGGRPQTGPYPR